MNIIFIYYKLTYTHEKMYKPFENDNDDYEQAMRVSDIFYNRYKSLCHGSSRRHELKRLYEDTQPIILKLSGDTKNLRFSQILYALSHGHNVLKVLGGNEIQWNVFNKTYNKYKQHPDKIEAQSYQYDKKPTNPEEEFDQEPLWLNYDLLLNTDSPDDQTDLTIINADKCQSYSSSSLYNYTEQFLPLGEFLPLGQFYTII